MSTPVEEPGVATLAAYPWHHRRDWIVAAAVTLLAPLLAFREVLLSGLTRIPGDVNDGRLNAFFLEHSWGWVSRQPLHHSFWGLPDFFPGGGNALAFSDLMFSFGPLYWPWRALGLPHDTSYQLWCISVLAASVLAGYLFFRLALELSPLASALGAWLASCSASRIHQISHSQLLPVFYVFAALGAVVVWARLEGRRERAIAAGGAGFAVVAQLYGGFYQGFFVLLVIATLAIGALLVRRSRALVLPKLRSDWPALLVIAMLAAAALVPWFRHYHAAQREMGPRAWEAMVEMVPRPQSWLFMPPGALAYGWIERSSPFRELPWWFEHAVGLGFLTTACGIAAAVASRRRLAVVLTLTTTFALMMLTTMVNGHTLWRHLVDQFPALSAARALSRIGLMLPIAAAVVLGTWLDGAVSARRRGVLAVVFALCGAEQVARMDTHDREVQRFWVNEVVQRVDRKASAFVVTRSSSRGGAMVVHLDAMIAANLTGVPTVNGASGNEPPGWEGLQWAKVRNETAALLFRGALADWVRSGGVDPATVQWIELPPRYRGGNTTHRRPKRDR